jgi:hypothetical protein
MFPGYRGNVVAGATLVVAFVDSFPFEVNIVVSPART